MRSGKRMNLTIQIMKRLLSGIFAGGVFFCVSAQDVAIDSFSTVPKEIIKAEPADLERSELNQLLEFGKVFSLRMMQRGKATAADMKNVMQLLAQDPNSMQLNVMLQNMFSKAPPRLRIQAEKQYCELAEKNPSAWIMQTFSAEILVRNKKTVSEGISRLYRVFQQELLNVDPASCIRQKELQSFRLTLLSRLLLLTFMHKKYDEYEAVSEFIRKNPACRKQPDLLIDWLLTSAGRRESSGPLPLLPGNVIPGKAMYALRDFHVGKREILGLISKGTLPSSHKCPILLSVSQRWGLNAELETALQQYIKVTDKRQWLAYVLLGDLIKGRSGKDLLKQASFYQKALETGLTYYDKRALHLVGIYLDLNDLKRAEQLLVQISRKAPKVNTIFHYIALYSARKDYKSALKRINTLPASPIRFQQEAYIRAFMKDYCGASKAVDKVWREMKKKKLEFRNQTFLFFSVDVAEKCKNIRMVKELLEPEIKKNPKDMNLKNTLGYILADHNTDLQKAYELLKEVVAAEPENGAFLDSMAWVLYRLKRYEEAKKYILLSLKYHSDRVILDHAGDIFYASGDRRSAEKYWRLALRAKGEVKAELILKKLKQLQSGKHK